MTYTAAAWVSQNDGAPDASSGYSYGAGEPPAGWSPHSAGSIYNTPIPGSPSIDATSADVVSWLNNLLGANVGPVNRYIAVGHTADDYDAPLYFSQDTDPLVRLKVAAGTRDVAAAGLKKICPTHNRLVRVPSIALAAGGTDQHMTVMSASHLVDMHHAKSWTPGDGSGRIGVGWGTVMPVNAANTDMPTGATSGHLPLQGLAIRLCELQAGAINHALMLRTKYVRANVFRSPATGAALKDPGVTAGDANDLKRPITGARLQLNMSSGAINALSIPAWYKTILHALATYGAFVGDTNASNSYDFLWESGATDVANGKTDRWAAFASTNSFSSVGSPGTAPYIVPMQQGAWWGNLQMLA